MLEETSYPLHWENLDQETYMRRMLEYQADQIEMVLSSHRVHGRVMGGIVTPRWVSYQVLPEMTTKISRIVALSEELALRLGAQGVRVARKGSAVQVDVPREQGEVVRLLNLCRKLPDVPKQTAILGMDESGLPLLLRLPSPDVAHALVAGTTGSGKTALVRSMALSLAMHNRLGEVQMVFIDPKGNGFEPFLGFDTLGGGLPHLLRPPVQEVHQAIFLLGEMVEEMVRRDREGISEPRVVIFIDELADLMEQGGKAMDRLMTRLTQRGRSAGLHIIACTQKPLVASIGSLTRSNFPVRLQLPGAIGRQCSQRGRCQDCRRNWEYRRGKAIGPGRFFAGGKRACDPFSSGLCGHAGNQKGGQPHERGRTSQPALAHRRGTPGRYRHRGPCCP